MKSNLAGLYIQIEAKKRRINIINLWKVPKRATVGPFSRLSSRPELGISEECQAEWKDPLFVNCLSVLARTRYEVRRDRLVGATARVP